MTGLIRSPYPRERGIARTVLLVAGWVTVALTAPWIITYPPVTYEGLGLVAGVGWGVLVGIGALLMLAGHLTRRHEVEIPGLLFLGTGLAIYVILSWQTVVSGSEGSGAQALLLTGGAYLIAERGLELVQWVLHLRRINRIGRGGDG